MSREAASRPGPLRAVAQRFPASTFCVLALVVTWSMWVPRALVSQGYLDSEWVQALGQYWTYGPAAAAVLAAWWGGGLTWLRELGARMRRWRVAWRWYAVVLLGPGAFWLAVVAVTTVVGWADHLERPLIVQQGIVAAVPLLLVLALTDGVGEETGWRGFALPRQLETMSALRASVLLGIVQAVWHLPLFWIEDAPWYGSPVWMLFAQQPAISILFTAIFWHTRGSALLAVLFHASSNLCCISAGLAGDGSWGPAAVVLTLTWLLAGAVVAFSSAFRTVVAETSER